MNMMKKITLFVLTLMMGFLGLNQELEGQTKVFDQTITWLHPPYAYGGYGFYWWHRTDGQSIINYGNMSSTDWSAYYNGNFTMAVEVISQPTSEPFYLQFGIWGDYYKGSKHTETVAGRQYVSGGAGSSGSFGLGSPSGWWQKQPSDPLDFSRPEDFYRIGVVLWDGASQCIPMGHDWSTTGCPENAYKYFPMTIKISVYATTGSGPPPPPPPPPPTVNPPSYTIDYWGTRTSQVISTEDQYSYDNFAGGTVHDGNNNYLYLTPGTDVYFRKKADWSKKQTLDVPSRPATPSFTIDYLNQRTGAVVSSAYQYSTNSNMSEAINGNGSHVALNPGTTLYFRQKATSSSFYSNIQTLTVPARPAAPAFTVDFMNERTGSVVSSDYQYSASSNMSSATSGNGSHVSLSPGSTVYFRKKATSSAFYSNIQTLTVPARPAAPAFTVDFMNERTGSVVSSDYQYSASSNMSSATSGNGSHVSLSPGSTVYFRKKASASAFYSQVQTLAVPGRPAAPAFTVDFMNERTGSVVSSDYQYSSNSDMSSAADGDGNHKSLSPGSTVYFRKKASASAFYSQVQTLVVPGRPEAPSFQIDFMSEEVGMPVSSEYDYGSASDLSDAVQGIGNVLPVIPGSNLYFRKRATGSAFASGIQTLESPLRPAAPSSPGIDYLNETTGMAIPATQQYASSADFSSAADGNGEALSLVPGTDVFLREKASVSAFSSEPFQLVVPRRPTVTSTESGSTYLYPFPADFTFFNEVNSLDSSGVEVVNAEVASMVSASSGSDESVFSAQVYATANDVITILIPANAVEEGNFASNTLEIAFAGQLPGVGIGSAALRSFSVFPNPGNGIFYLRTRGLDSQERYEVQCISISGKVFYTDAFYGADELRLDLAGLPEGLYMLRLSNDDQVLGLTKLIISND